MKSNLFIPKKIKIGFQNRNSTYTGKLAYITYIDEKGVLRKECSWDGWRDKDIEPVEADNIPIDGFVLNKKVGGYSTGWNHRQTYTRVYDSRGWEFEITVENLLYILENATSTKGKGLEGNFVYGWNGKDLILIPCDSPDYKELEELNNLRYSCKKFESKDLIIGATYKDNNNHNLVYMGRFYEANKDGTESKSYFFYNLDSEYRKITTIKTLNKSIIAIVDEKCIENYADLFEELRNSSYYSEREPKKDEYKYYTKEEFLERNKDWGQHFFRMVNNKPKRLNLEKIHRYSYGYYGRHENEYNVFTLSRGCNDEKISECKTLEYVFEEFKPMYLVSYKTNGELIKEWK